MFFRAPSGSLNGCLLTLLIAFPVACAQHPELRDWQCAVEQAPQRECAQINTLTKGSLRLNRNATFQLKGSYQSCYDSADVEIKGDLRYQRHGKLLELELLSKEITQQSEVVIEFPRTIGYANLDTSTLQGTFTDIWSAIRMKGMYQQQLVPVAMTCEGR